MKTLKPLILILGINTCLFACKTETTVTPLSGAINVTNAVVGGAFLTMSTNGLTAGANTIANNSSAYLPIIAGQVQVQVGIPAIAATLTTAAVPAVNYYNQSLTINNVGNYSLFLTGASPSAVESVLINETYPRTYSDSVCAIRFINLAPGSNPISVNIKGNANGSEVATLGYKAYTSFLQHPAKRVNPSYVLEFRDAGTGNLITSYTLSTPFFHNVTLALRGIVGGSPAPGVIQDNDF
jgi:hypothetical protein